MTNVAAVPAPNAVGIALDLGWGFAELYDAEELPGPSGRRRRTLPGHLPGLGDMTAHERACALSAYVGAGLTALAKATGAELPTAEPINDALVVTGQEHDTVRSVILDLYIDLRNRLAGGDPAVAVAFGLGRMLADTVLLPTSDKPQILVEQFGKWRLGNAFEWLDDLDASLPPRAGVAVRTSLRAWEEWVDKATKSGRTIRTPKVNAVAMRALRRQGNVWRRLLTGEQPADHLLDAKAYVSAAAHLLGKARRLTFHYLWKWSWAIVPALAAVGTAVWASVTYAPAGTGRVASWGSPGRPYGAALGRPFARGRPQCGKQKWLLL
jgi:hypothetical protein